MAKGKDSSMLTAISYSYNVFVHFIPIYFFKNKTFHEIQFLFMFCVKLVWGK